MLFKIICKISRVNLMTLMLKLMRQIINDQQLFAFFHFTLSIIATKKA